MTSVRSAAEGGRMALLASQTVNPIGSPGMRSRSLPTRPVPREHPPSRGGGTHLACFAESVSTRPNAGSAVNVPFDVVEQLFGSS